MKNLDLDTLSVESFDVSPPPVGELPPTYDCTWESVIRCSAVCPSAACSTDLLC